jgi:hypothetical protein
MGIFGWSLPPGCGTLPGEESGEAISLSQAFGTLPPNVLDVWWDEDGNILESFAVDVPADIECGIPAYTETQNAKVGTCEWSDDRSEEENIRAAVAAYTATLRGATQ